jgi:hypothetical protein
MPPCGSNTRFPCACYSPDPKRDPAKSPGNQGVAEIFASWYPDTLRWFATSSLYHCNKATVSSLNRLPARAQSCWSSAQPILCIVLRMYFQPNATGSNELIVRSSVHERSVFATSAHTICMCPDHGCCQADRVLPCMVTTRTSTSTSRVGSSSRARHRGSDSSGSQFTR